MLANINGSFFVFVSGIFTGAFTCFSIYQYLLHIKKQNYKSKPDVDPEFMELLREEQLARNFAFLGKNKMNSLRSSLVIVVGVGGVGSHAAHMLARSGIGYLRLIDFDNVTLSSLNRAPLARRSDVGLTKVDHLAASLKEIAPWINIESFVELFDKINADRLLLSSIPDQVSRILVLDCIDNIDTKIDLIQFCISQNIPLLSSCGAGCKLDPTKLLITDISKTTDDPLARTVRQRLRKIGISKGVQVIYSNERYNGITLKNTFSNTSTDFFNTDSNQNINSIETNPNHDVNGDKSTNLTHALVANFRSSIIPVLGPMPAIFGMAMAMYSIQHLTQI